MTTEEKQEIVKTVAGKDDEVQNELRDGLLHVVRTALLGVAGNLTAQNAARSLQLVERVCECERGMLAYLSGGVITKERGLGQYTSSYSEGIGAALGASEPDGETFGAQAIKSIIDTVTQALGALNGGLKPGGDQTRRREIEVAEAGLRAAKLLGDDDLIKSRRDVLRELLKSEDRVDGAGEFEPVLPGGLKPLPVEVDVGTRVLIMSVRRAENYNYAEIDPVGYVGRVTSRYGLGLRPARDDPRWLEGTIERLHHPCKPTIDRLSTLNASNHGIIGFAVEILEDELQEPQEKEAKSDQ